ncbi:MAG: NAD(P)-dependent alcohol dehydrogenase [Gemmatimonadaceae bacterium]|nr:NAD(P)-dependent alcohol dehydrogenase [Gemmatimonadaceae bacterium]
MPTPVPGPNDLLIRVRATTVTSADWRLRSLSIPYRFGLMSRIAFGLSAPRQPILGSELAGDVVAVGARVRTFAVGDAVVASAGTRLGAHAEFCCVAADGVVVPKPRHLAYESAAALAFGGTTALDFFRRAELRSGQRIVINGASGTVGSTMLQLAVAAGAEVTAVCSGANAALVRDLGATHVVDYTATDFAAEGVRYDLIADTVGNAPYARVRQALMPRGKHLAVLATLPEMLRAPWVRLTSSHCVVAGPVTERREDLHTIVTMAAAGRFTPLIDRCLPLTEIVAAHARVESGRKRGSVVVTVNDEVRPANSAP